jgi:hypothetical protein
LMLNIFVDQLYRVLPIYIVEKDLFVNIILLLKVHVYQIVSKVWKIVIHILGGVIEKVNNLRIVQNVFDVVWIHIYKRIKNVFELC